MIHINLYDLDSGVIAAQHLDQSSCSSSIEESCHQLCHQLPPAATSCPQLPPALATSFTTSSSISLESEQRRSYATRGGVLRPTLPSTLRPGTTIDSSGGVFNRAYGDNGCAWTRLNRPREAHAKRRALEPGQK